MNNTTYSGEKREEHHHHHHSEPLVHDIFKVITHSINQGTEPLRKGNDKFDDFGNFVAKSLRELAANGTQDVFAQKLISDVLTNGKMNTLLITTQIKNFVNE